MFVPLFGKAVQNKKSLDNQLFATIKYDVFNKSKRFAQAINTGIAQDLCEQKLTEFQQLPFAFVRHLRKLKKNSGWNFDAK